MLEFLFTQGWHINSSNELKLVATDDSMAPLILAGDILIVDKSIRDLSRVLVLIHDGKMFARWVKPSLEGGYELVSGNRETPGISVERLNIVGAVIATARGL